MAKFHGIIGYVKLVESKPGVWTPETTEREYSGDVLKNNSYWSTNSDSTNDDLNINNQISIVADPYAYQHFHEMKYVEYMGARWKIKNIDVQRPRLILSLGGVYNGQ